MNHWRESARILCDRHLAGIRQQASAVGADPDEVVADCRRHLETDLAERDQVGADDVAQAIARMGPAPTPDETGADAHSPSEKSQKPRSRRRARKSSPSTAGPWLTAIFGLALPLIALAMELAGQAFTGIFMFSPVPTPWHVLLVLCVPLAALLRHRNRAEPEAWRDALLGLGCGVACYYSLSFASMIPLGLIGILAMGLGLVLLAPLWAALLLLPAVLLRSAGRKWRLGGLVIGFLALGLPDLVLHRQQQILLAGMKGDRAAVEAVATWIPQSMLERFVASMGRVEPSPLLTRSNVMFASAQRRDEARDPEPYHQLLFKVTGQELQTLASFEGQRPPRLLREDPYLGSRSVGLRNPDLALKTARLDGSIDPIAALAYLEWTITFANGGPMDAEARLEWALPPGGVVSRVTLWVNGDAREAAFGSRGQTTAAYRAVAVVERRDPILVTTCGPDRVFIQAFPIPARGTLTARIGINAPAALDDEHGASLQLPWLSAANCSLPETQSVWLAAGADLQLGTQSAADRAMAIPPHRPHLIRIARPQATRLSAAPSVSGMLVQELQAMPDRDPLTVVLDHSRALAPWWAELCATLAAASPEVRILISEDSDAGWRLAGAQDLARLAPTPPQRGSDASMALAQALADSANGTVLWIHGPQPLAAARGAVVQALSRPQQPATLRLLPVQAGRVALFEDIDGLAQARALPTDGDPVAVLQRYLATRDDGLGRSWRLVDAAPTEAHASGPHLRRLATAAEVAALCRRGEHDEARRLAIAAQLVTPVSGAVVLEQDVQYGQHGLAVPEGEIPRVPGIPEPGLLIMLLLAAAVACWWQRRTRLA